MGGPQTRGGSGGGANILPNNSTHQTITQGISASTTPHMYATSSNFAAGLLPQGGSRIKVAVRIRPLLEGERIQGHECSRLKVQGVNEVV